MLKKKIVNVQTNEEIIVDLTKDEISEVELAQAEAQAAAKAQAEVEAAKFAEKAALLERLGITEEEAQLLLS
jgi:hypothetical protein